VVRDVAESVCVYGAVYTATYEYTQEEVTTVAGNNSSPAPYNFLGQDQQQIIQGSLHIESSGNSDGSLTVDGATMLTGAVTAPGGFNSGTVSTFGGLATVPPAVTTAGTVVSAGTVSNTTGYDVNVYASATSGIAKTVYPGIAGGTVPGTIAPGATADYYLANGQSIAVTYNGTLTWEWLAI
jgi:hypothetical protein